jgi:hypothetical protein
VQCGEAGGCRFVHRQRLCQDREEAAVRHERIFRHGLCGGDNSGRRFRGELFFFGRWFLREQYPDHEPQQPKTDGGACNQQSRFRRHDGQFHVYFPQRLPARSHAHRAIARAA